MTPEAQNAAIAEACGELQPPKCKPSIEQLEAILADPKQRKIQIMPDGQVRAVSDYLNDLNVMHEVEKIIEDKLLYGYWISMIQGATHETEDWCFIHATATQRAEAFLRTIGKWV